MKPTDYIVIMCDDITEFENQINENLEKGYMFLGELQVVNGIFTREMVKPAPMVTNVPVPSIKKENK